MSLLEHPVETIETKNMNDALEADGILIRKVPEGVNVTALGTTLLDFYDDDEEIEKQPAYETNYRLVNRVPHVVVAFADSPEGMDTYMAFRSGCTDSDGNRYLEARELPEEFMQCEDLQKGGILCFSITATSFSVEQIIAQGLQKRVATKSHLRVA